MCRMMAHRRCLQPLPNSILQEARMGSRLRYTSPRPSRRPASHRAAHRKISCDVTNIKSQPNLYENLFFDLAILQCIASIGFRKQRSSPGLVKRLDQLRVHHAFSHFSSERPGRTSDVTSMRSTVRSSTSSMRRRKDASVMSVNQRPLRMPSWSPILKLR